MSKPAGWRDYLVCRADDSATLVATLPLHCRCISIPTGSFDSTYRLVFAWFGPPIAICNFARKVIRLPLVFHWRITHIRSSLSILGYDGMMCTILFPGWYTFRYFFIEAVIPLLLAFQGSMIRLRQLRSLLVRPLNLFDFHLLSFGSASWRWMECRFLVHIHCGCASLQHFGVFWLWIFDF